MAALMGELGRVCAEGGLRCPSRATVYKYMALAAVHHYEPAALPEHVKRTLYNLGDEAPVPGHQLVFHCFNYGGLKAMSYAASLPWLSLYQAARARGWRPKSLGPLLAVCRARGI